MPTRVRRLAYLMALGFLLLPQHLSAAMGSDSRVPGIMIDEWLHSTPRIQLTKGRLPSGTLATVATVKGTHVGGFVSWPQGALDARLASGQEVMVLPLASGGSGGIFYALLFTRIHGAITFVGYLHSNGHLFVYLSQGTLHIVRPVYALNDAQCCPSKHDYQIGTLHGTRVVVLKHWIAPSLRSR